MILTVLNDHIGWSAVGMAGHLMAGSGSESENANFHFTSLDGDGDITLIQDFQRLLSSESSTQVRAKY